MDRGLPGRESVSRLADRLARLRESGLAPASRMPNPEGPHPRAGDSPESPPPPEARPRKPLRPVLGKLPPPGGGPHRRIILPDEPPPGEGWRRIDKFVWERISIHSALLPTAFESGFIVNPGTLAHELIFYDLETTGLSGGAGNIAFLIGVARQDSRRHKAAGDGFDVDGAGGEGEPEVLTVTQLFLSDYPGEAAMLERLRGLFAPRAARVSYNGRCFDSQVIRNRFLLNRLRPPDASGAPEVDLLYPARRLWRGRLADLSLTRVEAEVLGVHRRDDVPGSEAPEAWFEWLRHGSKGVKGAKAENRITGVVCHNHDDIIALVRLLNHLEHWGTVDPRSPPAARPPSGAAPPYPGTPVLSPGKSLHPVPGAAPTYRGTAAQWFGREAPNAPGASRALAWLEAGWARGERECGRPLAYQMKRRGEWMRARGIWEALDRPGARDYHAAVELAKLHEHRLKDPAAALAVLHGLPEGIPEENLGENRREELKKRRRRLERKIEKLKGPETETESEIYGISPL